MRKRSFATCAALASAVVLSAGLAGPVTGAAAAPSQPAWETTDMIAAYLRDYPGMTHRQAERAVRGQGQRVRLLERLQAENPAGFGGSWYDPRTDTQHINSVGGDGASHANQVAGELGVPVATHPVSRSFTDLVALANRQGAIPDPIHNTVRASTDTQQTSADELCGTRDNCGTPLRSGIYLWGTGIPERCSLGFTASATDGSKWAVTAGHCGAFTGPDVIWGHGEQPIGPIRAGRNSGNIDVARIRVDNRYWQTGGWFYNPGAPNSPTPVDHAIVNRGTIQKGDGVCLSARWSVPGNACGTIVTPFGPFGMPQVTFDACPGDSGGGWYFLINGQRWAYGIHKGQPPNTVRTCHNHAANDSIFTAVPDLNAWWDSTTAATLRIESR